MKGYELIKVMSEGKVKEHTKIDVWFCNNLIDTLECIEGGLKWQPGGRFDTSYLCDDMAEFVIIEEQQDIDIQNIEDIKDVFIENASCGEDVKYLARKYNELVQAVKQLDKNKQDKE